MDNHKHETKPTGERPKSAAEVRYPFSTSERRALAILADTRNEHERLAKEADAEIRQVIEEARIRHGIKAEALIGLDIPRGQFVEMTPKPTAPVTDLRPSAETPAAPNGNGTAKPEAAAATPG